MSKRIKVTDLPDFDAARYLDGEAAIAAYLADIRAANDCGLLAAALTQVVAIASSAKEPAANGFRAFPSRGGEVSNREIDILRDADCV